MDGVRDNSNEPSDWPSSQEDDSVEPHRALGPFHGYGYSGAGGDPETHGGRAWHQEISRWLATLDSERTRREYEKAVGYFFRIPGVPETLEALTFDLLLAYRGSLALRAERALTATGHMHVARQHGSRQIQQEIRAPEQAPHLNASANQTTGDDFSADDPTKEIPSVSPLAPATVNIRLTALRQFLAHCSLWGLLPDLPPDRVRAALRRLRIERRRPYQILAEPEWADFLRAAKAPGALASDRKPHVPQERSSSAAPDHKPEPGVTPHAATDTEEARLEASLDGLWWGVPRTGQEHRQEHQTENRTRQARRPAHGNVERGGPPLPRSPAGLTGVYTAQRDHALLALALATGLRAIELCHLDLGDLTREWNAGREEWWLVLPDAKTKGQHGGRTLPLSPELAATLLEYAAATGRQWARTADRATPLFLSQHFSEQQPSGQQESRRATRGRLSPPHVRRIVDRVERQWLAGQHGGDNSRRGTQDTKDQVPDT